MKLALIILTAGGLSGGYRKYLCNVLPRLSTNSSIEKIVCAVPAGVTLNHIMTSFSNIQFVEIGRYGIMNTKMFTHIKKILDEFAPDVVYVPNERFFGYERAPVVNMLQNMEPFVRPFSGNPLMEKIKNCLRIYNSPKALKRADRIIAVSRFVKDYLINKLNIDSEKIGLVYHGISQTNLDMAVNPKNIPQNWQGKFLFTAGSIRPARGLEDIAIAFDYLRSLGYPLKLVIAGSLDPGMEKYKQKVNNLIKSGDYNADIVWAGSLAASEMAWCYSNCSIFVMTSRVESFGQIAVEAMSHGCLCISANNPCLPEIFREVAVYYPPKDSETLGEEIKEVLSWSDEKRSKVSARAKERAAQFSWDVCAEKTVEQLQLAIEDYTRSGKRKRK